jgi:aryl-alcohol dehydrogenase-like predicted oxidoreductase
MQITKLGQTGLKVSRLCLGCMTYGEPDRGTHEWTLPEAEARPFIARALEHGINFFDTANVYSAGSSEEILGRAIKDMVPRDEVVIATKVHGRMRKDANGQGLSRKAIFGEIDASLTRLGMDFVDLYQIHRFDAETPIEETLEALHDVVQAGKARYIGASSMQAWQFCKALYVAKLNGWTRFVSMQNHLNLLYREEAGNDETVHGGRRRRDSVEPDGAWPPDAGMDRGSGHEACRDRPVRQNPVSGRRAG